MGKEGPPKCLKYRISGEIIMRYSQGRKFTVFKGESYNDKYYLTQEIIKRKIYLCRASRIINEHKA